VDIYPNLSVDFLLMMELIVGVVVELEVVLVGAVEQTVVVAQTVEFGV
jgi:hypothetical protein